MGCANEPPKLSSRSHRYSIKQIHEPFIPIQSPNNPILESLDTTDYPSGIIIKLLLRTNPHSPTSSSLSPCSLASYLMQPNIAHTHYHAQYRNYSLAPIHQINLGAPSLFSLNTQKPQSRAHTRARRPNDLRARGVVSHQPPHCHSTDGCLSRVVQKIFPSQLVVGPVRKVREG